MVTDGETKTTRRNNSMATLETAKIASSIENSCQYTWQLVMGLLYSLPKFRIKELITLQFAFDATNIQMVHIRKTLHSRELNREENFPTLIFAAFAVDWFSGDGS